MLTKRFGKKRVLAAAVIILATAIGVAVLYWMMNEGTTDPPEIIDSESIEADQQIVAAPTLAFQTDTIQSSRLWQQAEIEIYVSNNHLMWKNGQSQEKSLYQWTATHSGKAYVYGQYMLLISGTVTSGQQNQPAFEDGSASPRLLSVKLGEEPSLIETLPFNIYPEQIDRMIYLEDVPYFLMEYTREDDIARVEVYDP